jgi:hypothetical protein
LACGFLRGAKRSSIYNLFNSTVKVDHNRIKKGCESMKTLSFALYLPTIYGISSPMTILIYFWRSGPMIFVIPIKRLFYLQESCIPQEEKSLKTLLYFKMCIFPHIINI